ncbi:headcase protein homolog [Hypomesus transpacificus]|uniref:headcase protein homolog n=1 Tax=Hypomesus transpacificus TaxID=137520 RepID=UPI001F0767DC|nr:headcase protein homolog [Hypomesus transpacificus]
MSFLSGILGGGKTDKMVDQAVDKVAVVAKTKVKEMMGGAAADGVAAGGAAAGAAGAGGQAPAGGAPAGGGTDIGGVAAGAMDAFSGMFSADDKKEKKPSSAGGALDLADSLDF